MGNEPFTVDLSVGISDAHDQFERLTLCIGSRHALNRMTVTEIAIRNDGQIAKLKLQRSLDSSKQALPILMVRVRANILPWRHYVEYDERLTGHVHLHDCIDVLGIERSYE